MTKTVNSINYEVVTKVTVPVSLSLLDEFLKLKCMEDIVDLFPNAKEITESMVAFRTVSKHLGMDALANRNIRCLVVGDGGTPRTGALFAYRSRWSVLSVDPNLAGKEFSVKRLTTSWDRIKDVVPFFDRGVLGVLVHVHSHAPMDEGVRVLNCDRVVAFALPCCVPQLITGQSPIIDRRHYGVLSPENRIMLWDFETGGRQWVAPTKIESQLI